MNKKSLALVLSLLIPVSPVLAASTAADPPVDDAAARNAAANKDAHNTAASLTAGTRTDVVVGAGQPAEVQPAAPLATTTYGAYKDGGTAATTAVPGPIVADDQAQPASKGSFFKRHMGAIGGAIGGGVIGFLIGGPIGGLIGFVVGGAGGELISRLVRGHTQR